MTIFDSIKYPVPELKPWNSSLDERVESLLEFQSFISSLPYELVDNWKEHPEFQWSSVNLGTYYINQNNLDLLRRLILRYDSDNL